MNIIDTIIQEFTHEEAVTRKLLETFDASIAKTLKSMERQPDDRMAAIWPLISHHSLTE